jgi:amidohydrolase
MPDFLQEAQALFDFSRDLRRDLHMHPELGFQEVRTAGIVARELSQLGMEVTTGVAKTGVIGLLEGERPGPVILLRFDMDALPVTEETGAEYASRNPGVMHACGHDAHVSTGLTVARLLHQHRSELAGTVKFMFQPAEEGLGGASGMMDAGLLENPAPVKALSLHVWNDRPVGWVGVAPGPVMAGAGSFRLRLVGKGGHGASPHQTIDPLLAGVQIVTALQSVVSRNISPLQSGVVSVTQFHSGDAVNIIPQVATLAATIRFFDPAVQKTLYERVEQIIVGIAQAMGCVAELQMGPTLPAVVNDAGISARVAATARQTLPDFNVDTNYQTMGSEDMSLVLQKVPGCYFFVGAGDPQIGHGHAHHHPKFDIDERVLPNAAGLMASAAFDLLQE